MSRSDKVGLVTVIALAAIMVIVLLWPSKRYKLLPGDLAEDDGLPDGVVPEPGGGVDDVQAPVRNRPEVEPDGSLEPGYEYDENGVYQVPAGIGPEPEEAKKSAVVVIQRIGQPKGLNGESLVRGETNSSDQTTVEIE